MSEEIKSELNGDEARERIIKFWSKKGVRYLVLEQERGEWNYTFYIKVSNRIPILAFDFFGKLDLTDALYELAYLGNSNREIVSITRAKIVEMPNDETGIGGKLRPALYIKYRGTREIKPLYEITK